MMVSSWTGGSSSVSVSDAKSCWWLLAASSMVVGIGTVVEGFVVVDCNSFLFSVDSSSSSSPSGGDCASRTEEVDGIDPVAASLTIGSIFNSIVEDAASATIGLIVDCDLLSFCCCAYFFPFRLSDDAVMERFGDCFFFSHCSKESLFDFLFLFSEDDGSGPIIMSSSPSPFLLAIQMNRTFSSFFISSLSLSLSADDDGSSFRNIKSRSHVTNLPSMLTIRSPTSMACWN
mmetsp:Transcript_45501/g.95519  ORF Transcript_45501/g.95519 Transcript_45501/m.95519 type:complete len:231 (+) Transcript_45501:971-1663(+)